MASLGSTSVGPVSNEGFGELGELLGDSVMAAAILDRLMHHSHILNTGGERYPLRGKRQAEPFSSHHLLGLATENGNDNYSN